MNRHSKSADKITPAEGINKVYDQNGQYIYVNHTK